MVTGKIKVWPSGGNYTNKFVQMYLKISNESELLLFNGYMDDEHISNMNVLLAEHWAGIQLINKKGKDPRKTARDQLNDWAKARNVTAYTSPIIYLTQVKLELLTIKKPSVDDEDLETEI